MKKNMRYIYALKMDGCTYTIYQDNNRFCIFRKEKEGNVNQLKPVFKSAEDAKAWVNNVLIPAWQKWHECNKVAGQVYLDDPDELNEAKNMKRTIRLNESQLRGLIKESIKKVLKENNTNTINALSAEIGCSPQNIYRDETHPYRYFVKGMDGDRDVEYLVFDNEEQAKEYALHIFDAKGAAPLDYYIQNAKLAGANMEILFPNGKPNWKKIEEFIVDTCGPEWVLAGYDGEPIALDNGQIAYRWD